MKHFFTFILKFAFCAFVLAGIIKVVFFVPKTEEEPASTSPANSTPIHTYAHQLKWTPFSGQAA